jgi:hypothetical protein
MCEVTAGGIHNHVETSNGTLFATWAHLSIDADPVHGGEDLQVQQVPLIRRFCQRQ